MDRRDFPIVIDVATASEAELLKGTVAAMAVLEKAKVSPVEAANGAFAREQWDLAGFPDSGSSAGAAGAAAAWDQADTAALEAVCEGWPRSRRPDSAALALLTDPEAQLATRAEAIAMLKVMAREDAGGTEWERACSLAERAGGGILDRHRARDLVGDVTRSIVTATAAPAPAARRMLEAAIDALERAALAH